MILFLYMNEEIPQIIKDVGFDFDWSEEKVWALDVPVEEIDISELTWHFDDPDAHKDEYKRTMKANLIHPIDVMENKGRWLILDGLHRLMKATILKMNKIRVRKIPREKIPEILE